MAAKVQLTGGSFQDSEGNLLASGYLLMKLNQDETVVGSGQVCSGIEIKILLDANGVVVASPAQSIWGNDQMVPVNSYYRVSGYTASGQLAWGPNNQQVIGNGGTFDVGTWVPNSVLSWFPGVQVPELEVNSTPNVDQNLLNLIDTATISWTDHGNGSVSAASSATALSLKTNGTTNGSQSLLNLKQGTNMTITDDGVGGITFASAIPTQTGFFYVGKDTGLAVTGTATNIQQNAGAGTISFMMFELLAARQFQTLTAECTSGDAGKIFAAAIYDSTGATKLGDFGTQSMTTPAVFTLSMGSPLTLAAGQYLFACGHTSGIAVAFRPTYNTGSGVAGVFNANTTKIGIATNLVISGMPSSLGSLTAQTVVQNFNYLAGLIV